MGISSKYNGDKGERLMVSFFRERGYWIHVSKRDRQGAQPVDGIAIKKNEAWLLDAKYVENGYRLDFSDIQPNQVTSMRYARDYAGVENLGFFVVFGQDEGTPYLLEFATYEKLAKEGKKSANTMDMKDFGEYLENG